MRGQGGGETRDSIQPEAERSRDIYTTPSSILKATSTWGFGTKCFTLIASGKGPVKAGSRGRKKEPLHDSGFNKIKVHYL